MWLFIILAIAIVIGKILMEKDKIEKRRQYESLKSEILNELKLNISIFSEPDEDIIVKSRQALENYSDLKYFKENREKLEEADKIIKEKKYAIEILKKFLEGNNFSNRNQYYEIAIEFRKFIDKGAVFVIEVTYISSAGNNLGSGKLYINQFDIEKYKENPSLLMNKGEYNRLVKEEQKRILQKKQKEYYSLVNDIIDYANENKESLIIRESRENLDNLIGQLFDRTVNSIKKIKVIDSEEWALIRDFISNIKNDVEKIVTKNQKIFQYYECKRQVIFVFFLAV